MRRMSMASYSPCLVAGALLLVQTASPIAQRRAVDNGSEGAPASTNAIVQNAGAYYGKIVTVSAGVEEVLSKTAFLVDQRKVVNAQDITARGAPVLVIAPYLTSDIHRTDSVVVRGEIVKLEPGDLARVAPEYGLDLPPEMQAKYAGQPVLVATSVRDSRYAELAAKP